MWTVLAAMAAASPACPAVPGAEQLWAKPATRWVVIGELHGTNEQPAAFADLVCLAARSRRPLVVALEYPQDEQAALDAYMASDGGAEARATLTRGTFWHRQMQDGRSSVATLALIERLRLLKRAGHIAEVRGIDPGIASPPGPGGRDTGMAANLRSLAPIPGGLVMAYIGNVHATKAEIKRPTYTYTPTAGQLSAAETLSAWIGDNGGGAWTCERDGCKEHGGASPHQAVRGVTPAPAGAPFDMMVELGVSTTAAAPAVVAP